MPQPSNEISQQDYLNLFDITQNGGIEEQCWAKANKSIKHTACQPVYCVSLGMALEI